MPQADSRRRGLRDGRAGFAVAAVGPRVRAEQVGTVWGGIQAYLNY